jgi:hypothetical protein
MHVIDYTVLCQSDPGNLGNQVAKLLREGWQPYGPPQVVAPLVNEEPAPGFYQAMVLYAKSDTTGSPQPTFVRVNDELAVTLDDILEVKGLRSGSFGVVLKTDPETTYMVRPEFRPAFLAAVPS